MRTVAFTTVAPRFVTVPIAGHPTTYPVTGLSLAEKLNSTVCPSFSFPTSVSAISTSAVRYDLSTKVPTLSFDSRKSPTATFMFAMIPSKVAVTFLSFIFCTRDSRWVSLS